MSENTIGVATIFPQLSGIRENLLCKYSGKCGLKIEASEINRKIGSEHFERDDALHCGSYYAFLEPLS